MSFAVGSPGLGQLTLSGGTLSGTGDLPVNGPFGWSGGALSGAGRTTTGDATLSGSAAKDLLDGRLLVTSGVSSWLGQGQVRLGGGSSIHAGGQWDVQSNGSMTTSDGTGSLLIPGGATLHKTSPGGTTLAVPLNNAGTVSLDSGTLILSAGSSTAGAFQGGLSTTLQFAGGAHALLPGSTVLAGLLNVSSGSLTVEGTYGAYRSTFSGGTTTFGPAAVVASGMELFLSNAAIADFSSGADVVITVFSMTGGTLRGTDSILHGYAGSQSDFATWSGGEMVGPGRSWLQTPQLLVFGSAPKDLTGGRLLETLTVSWDGSGPIRVGEGARIRGSRWTLHSDVSFVDLGGAGGFENYSQFGVFRKAGGSGTSVVGIPFTNAGTVQASSGTLRFAAGYTQTAGTTLLDGGTLAATMPLVFQGGSLRGVGSVAGDVMSAGTVRPGQSPGVLTIAGRYTQAAGGTLALEIGGLSPGSQHDRLVVTGATSLAGLLNVALINGFVPQGGDTFTVLTAPEIGGAFNGMTAPPLPNGVGWLVRVEPTRVVLEIAADTDGDGLADAGDCAPLDPAAGYPPAEVAGLALSADKQTLSWQSQTVTAGSTTVYDVVSGAVSGLPVSGVGEICLLSGGETPQVLDPTVPAPGACFYYLVRARNACGIGTYGVQSSGVPRTTATCP